jgi:hypothetical protein
VSTLAGVHMCPKLARQYARIPYSTPFNCKHSLKGISSNEDFMQVLPRSKANLTPRSCDALQSAQLKQALHNVLRLLKVLRCYSDLKQSCVQSSVLKLRAPVKWIPMVVLQTDQILLAMRLSVEVLCNFD